MMLIAAQMRVYSGHEEKPTWIENFGASQMKI
jgi:hypothetical protein